MAIYAQVAIYLKLGTFQGAYNPQLPIPLDFISAFRVSDNWPRIIGGVGGAGQPCDKMAVDIDIAVRLNPATGILSATTSHRGWGFGLTRC